MKIIVDNSSEIFGSEVSIADLAQFATILQSKVSYGVFEAMKSDYRFELKEAQIFEFDRFILTFKDGSKLIVEEI
jgi:hypothetical protein